MRSPIAVLTSDIGNAARLPLSRCIASTDMKLNAASRSGYDEGGSCRSIVCDITREVVDMDRVVCEGGCVGRRRREPGQLEVGGV